MAGNKLGHNGYDFHTTDKKMLYTLEVEPGHTIEGTPQQLINKLISLI